MKKVLLFIICIGIALIGCKKENENNDDLLYKSKLETLVNFKQASNNQISVSNDSNKPPDFKTYKEAYAFFSSLRNFQIKDTAQSKVMPEADVKKMKAGTNHRMNSPLLMDVPQMDNTFGNAPYLYATPVIIRPTPLPGINVGLSYKITFQGETDISNLPFSYRFVAFDVAFPYTTLLTNISGNPTTSFTLGYYPAVVPSDQAINYTGSLSGTVVVGGTTFSYAMSVDGTIQIHGELGGWAGSFPIGTFYVFTTLNVTI